MGAIRQSPLSSGAKLCPASIFCRHPEEESSYMIPNRSTASIKQKAPARQSVQGPLSIKIMTKPFYQMDTRSAFGKNIGSFSVILKASYQASIWGNAPFTRHSPSECTSIFVR